MTKAEREAMNAYQKDLMYKPDTFRHCNVTVECSKSL